MRNKSIVYSLLIVFYTIALAGCASTPPVVFWKKDNTHYKKAQDDYNKCEYDIKMNKVPKDERTELVDNCMQMHGYRVGSYH